MNKKYILPLILILIVSSIVSAIVSSIFIKSPDNYEKITFTKVINITPETLNGRSFKDLSQEERLAFFEFRFPDQYFNDQTIETYEQIILDQ